MPSALIFTPDPVDVPALDQDPRFFVPAYYGPYGARAIDLDGTTLDWNEITELVDAPFSRCARQRIRCRARCFVEGKLFRAGLVA